MTISAWIMLATTWTLVAFFTIRFFVLLHRSNNKKSE